jgi:hypothetical protein
MMTILPDPETELQTLALLEPVLREAFETGTELACQYFEAEGLEIDRALYPEIVRYRVKQFLDTQHLHATDDDESYSRDPVRRNGLSLVYQNRRYRIWKADGDLIPSPGSSVARQSFLSQQTEMFLGSDGALRELQMNLVVLWNVDQNYRFRQFHLVYPAEWDGQRVRTHWTVQVPMTALPRTAAPVSATADDDLPFTFVADAADERAE